VQYNGRGFLMAITTGLGRNSPIVIESNPQNFEGLIIRHGQWVRWSVAHKCGCTDSYNQPDPACTLCKGVGWQYSFDNNEEMIESDCKAVDSHTIDLVSEVPEGTVIESAYLPDGTFLTIEGLYGQWLKIKEILKGRETVFVTYKSPREEMLPSEIAYYAGNGIVMFNEKEYINATMTVPYDLSSVTSVKDFSENSFPITSFSVDRIIIDVTNNEPSIGDILIVNASYMPPFKVAIVNQNLSVVDRDALKDIGGDSIIIFPYKYQIAQDDIISCWNSSQIRKHIVRRNSVNLEDELPDHFITEIKSIYATKDSINTMYTEGNHFQRTGRDTIRWISDTRPADGSYYAIEYVALMSYRVIPNLPNVRSSENKRFPMRAALKLMTGKSSGDPL
jgi:hypothetical protein